MQSTIQNETIVSLLQKYIENKCTEEELETLLTWLKTSEETASFDWTSKILWEKINSQASTPNEQHIEKLNQEVDALLLKIKRQKQPLRNKISFLRWNWVYQISAAVLLFFVLGTSYYLYNKVGRASIQYTEIYAATGDIQEYTLDDGTHVILNSESKLIIPSDYNKENRTIKIEGEGFFEVTKNPDKPFVVTSGHMQVKVLGTSFNVKAYKEDNYTNVTVATGKVLVNASDFDLQLSLTPSEHLSINKITGELTKLSTDDTNFTSWIEGELYFENEPIEEVVKTLNRKYNKEIVLECKGCSYMISGTHDNKSVEAVIESICFTTGLKRKKERGKIILYK